MVLLLAGPDGLTSMDVASGESTPISTEAVTAIDRVGQQIGYVTSAGVIHLCDAQLTECTTGPAPSTDTIIQLASEMANPEILYLLTQTFFDFCCCPFCGVPFVPCCLFSF